jgi:hypothetical protein
MEFIFTMEPVDIGDGLELGSEKNEGHWGSRVGAIASNSNDDYYRVSTHVPIYLSLVHRIPYSSILASSLRFDLPSTSTSAYPASRNRNNNALHEN